MEKLESFLNALPFLNEASKELAINLWGERLGFAEIAGLKGVTKQAIHSRSLAILSKIIAESYEQKAFNGVSMSGDTSLNALAADLFEKKYRCNLLTIHKKLSSLIAEQGLPFVIKDDLVINGLAIKKNSGLLFALSPMDSFCVKMASDGALYITLVKTSMATLLRGFSQSKFSVDEIWDLIKACKGLEHFGIQERKDFDDILWQATRLKQYRFFWYVSQRKVENKNAVLRILKEKSVDVEDIVRQCLVLTESVDVTTTTYLEEKLREANPNLDPYVNCYVIKEILCDSGKFDRGPKFNVGQTSKNKKSKTPAVSKAKETLTSKIMTVLTSSESPFVSYNDLEAALNDKVSYPKISIRQAIMKLIDKKEITRLGYGHEVDYVACERLGITDTMIEEFKKCAIKELETNNHFPLASDYIAAKHGFVKGETNLGKALAVLASGQEITPLVRGRFVTEASVFKKLKSETTKSLVTYAKKECGVAGTAEKVLEQINKLTKSDETSTPMTIIMVNYAGSK